MAEVLRVKNYKKANKPEKKLFTSRCFLTSQKQNKIYNYLSKSLINADIQSSDFNNLSLSPIKYIEKYDKKPLFNFNNVCVVDSLIQNKKQLRYNLKLEKLQSFFTHKENTVCLNYVKYSTTIEKLNEIYIKYFLIKFFQGKAHFKFCEPLQKSENIPFHSKSVYVQENNFSFNIYNKIFNPINSFSNNWFQNNLKLQFYKKKQLQSNNVRAC